MIIGYLRVSSGGQTVDSQRLSIYDAGYKPDHWFEVSSSSRKGFDKRKISELMEALKSGDRLVVSELSRLSRSIGQTILIIDEIYKAGAELHCIKENIKLVGGKRDIQSKVMTTMFALFAEIERDLISERTKEGIERARQSGKILGRPKGNGPHPLDNQRLEIITLLGKGISISSIAKMIEKPEHTVGYYIKTRRLKKVPS